MIQEDQRSCVQQLRPGTTRQINNILKTDQVISLDDEKSEFEKYTSSLPKCPMCGSTNIQKISDFSRASSIIGFGILSKKIGKQWQCNNPKCKHLW